jgi:dihydropteroate synthase
MGVVNLTPDSFYDGGRHIGDRGVAAVDHLLEGGADIIDIGGESSRPGAVPVPAGEQIERITAALEHAVGRGALVSVDTTSPEVAEFAARRGARMINDVSCLADDGLADVAARHGAALVVTHSRGPVGSMSGYSQWPDSDYGDIVEEVLAEWSAARTRAVARGVPAEHVLLDPGLGFSKNARQSLELVRRSAELRRAGTLIVLGPSRKSFVSAVDSSPPEERLGGTIACCLFAAATDGVDILRVHDVQPVRQALRLQRALGGVREPAHA